MTDFTTHTIESAPENSKPLLQAAKDTYSFVPNLLGNMASSPALLEGYIRRNRYSSRSAEAASSFRVWTQSYGW